MRERRSFLHRPGTLLTSRRLLIGPGDMVQYEAACGNPCQAFPSGHTDCAHPCGLRAEMRQGLIFRAVEPISFQCELPLEPETAAGPSHLRPRSRTRVSIAPARHSKIGNTEGASCVVLGLPPPAASSPSPRGAASPRGLPGSRHSPISEEQYEMAPSHVESAPASQAVAQLDRGRRRN